MRLTEKEKRLVGKLSHPRWPRMSLYASIIWALAGICCLAFTSTDLGKLYDIPYLSQQPDGLAILIRIWFGLISGGIALTCAIFLWVLRSYGLVIRKLTNKTEA